MRVSYVVFFVTAAIFASAIARPSSRSRAKNLERRVRSVLPGYRYPKFHGYNPYPMYQDLQSPDYAPAVPDWRSQNHENGNHREMNFNDIDQQFVSPVKTQRVLDDEIDSNMEFRDRDDSEDSELSNDSEDSEDSNENDDSEDSEQTNDRDDSSDSEDSNNVDREWFDENDDSVQLDDRQSQNDQQENQKEEIDVQKPVQEYSDMNIDLDSKNERADSNWEQEKELRSSINPRVGSGSAISGRNNLDYSWDEKSAPLQEQWDNRPMESNKPSPPSYSCIDICEQVEFNHRDLPEIRSLCDCSNYATSYIRK